MKEKVIVVMGPTATGKSALGLWLAEKLDTEIISGDSMLVYKGFDVGTAKPSQEELSRVKHHLVDIITAENNYSAAAFQQQAAKLITQMNSKGKIPLLVGGTGLYIKALLEGYEFSPVIEQTALREKLEQEAEVLGSKQLYERLLKLSPEIAKEIHPNNCKRIVRALEVALSGEQISRAKQSELVYDAFVIGLTADRKNLYERINERVEEMFAAEFVKEVESLIASGIPLTSSAMQALGYKDVVNYLQGKIDFFSCKNLVAQHTRNFAKRQFTWYKKMPYANWFDINKYQPREKMHDIIWHELVKWQKLE